MGVEELLARLRRPDLERQEAAVLREDAAAQARATLEQFVSGLATMPEMSEVTGAEISAAMRGYLEALTTGTPDDIAKAVAGVRSLQGAHYARLASGPTRFLFLNQLLVRLDAVQSGAAPRDVLAPLLAGAAGFLQSLERDGASVEVLGRCLEALGRDTKPHAVDDLLDAAQAIEDRLFADPIGSAAVRVGAEFLEGRCGPEAVLAAAEPLVGMSGLRAEGGVALQALAATRDPRALRAARALVTAAAALGRA